MHVGVFGLHRGLFIETGMQIIDVIWRELMARCSQQADVLENVVQMARCGLCGLLRCVQIAVVAVRC